MSVTVIHLVREANGPEPLAGFLDAYFAHPSGITHQLLFACKGYVLEIDDDDLRPVVTGYKLFYPDHGFDIGTYRRAALDVDTDYICCLNSFSRPLVDGWLAKLMAAATQPNVAIAGCTGSLEGIRSSPAPNPHIRTNAFCMRRELFIELAPVDPMRDECLEFEAGPNSLTKRAGRAVVVSANAIWDLEVARDSNTFRWGEQANLLVADNRTDHYQNANARDRDYLEWLAWGDS